MDLKVIFQSIVTCILIYMFCFRFPSTYRATPPPRRPMPCRGQGQRPQAGQGPCITPTTNPFGATTDPFEGMMTEPYGMTDIPGPTQTFYLNPGAPAGRIK